MSWDILDTAGNVTGTVVESASGFGPVGWFVIFCVAIVAWGIFITLYTFGGASLLRFSWRFCRR